MLFEHDSHNLIYRAPFGACATDEKVRLRLFCADTLAIKDVVCLTGDRELAMKEVSKGKGGIMYECTLTLPPSPTLIFYSFRIKTQTDIFYYGNNADSLGGVGEVYSHTPEKCFQITVYDKSFRTPDWMKNAVVYQIFPDRFCRGKYTPFHGIKRNWGEEPYWKEEQFGGVYLSNDFFGGNFDGIEKKLPYLKELGITAVYLNPVSKAFSNHRYDTGDYEIPDETLGTAEDFEKLCRTAEKAGIKIILDGVYSHTGADSKYFNKYGNYESVGAYQSEKSPFFSWYNFESFPDKYDSWWGFKTLPNVNELDKTYTDYILEKKDSVIKKWVSRGASGFRLDVADELPDEFIRIFRKELKKASPDALLIGEVWEDASNKISYGKRREFLLGNELDSVMNYVFRQAVLDYLLTCDEILFTMRIMSLLENYPSQALYSAMNLISSHDVPRALTVLSGAPDFRSMPREEQQCFVLSDEMLYLAGRRMVLALFLQMTLPGAPTVYYGDERGMKGYADPFNRTCIDWDNKNEVLFSQTKLLASFRAKTPCLRTGGLKILYARNGIIAFVRYIKNGVDAFGESAPDGSVLAIVNPADSQKVLNLDVTEYADNIKDALSGEEISSEGKLDISLEPLSYRLFTLER